MVLSEIGGTGSFLLPNALQTLKNPTKKANQPPQTPEIHILANYGIVYNGPGAKEIKRDHWVVDPKTL